MGVGVGGWVVVGTFQTLVSRTVLDDLAARYAELQRSLVAAAASRTAAAAAGSGGAHGGRTPPSSLNRARQMLEWL